MKKFTLHTYIFSILILLLCMNIAHAFPDQMFECIVPAKSEQINYKVKWIASKQNIYSTFGKSLTNLTDADDNLIGLASFTDGHTDFKNYWSIQGKKSFTGSITWNVVYVIDGETKLDAKGLKCKKKQFDQSLANKATTYFNDEAHTEDQLFPWHANNPLRLEEIDARSLTIADDETCTVEFEGQVGEKTDLLPKKRCCSKASKMCVLL